MFRDPVTPHSWSLGSRLDPLLVTLEPLPGNRWPYGLDHGPFRPASDPPRAPVRPGGGPVRACSHRGMPFWSASPAGPTRPRCCTCSGRARSACACDWGSATSTMGCARNRLRRPGPSNAWPASSGSRCTANGPTCARCSGSCGTSVETAGREARYDFFRRTAERHGYTKVALGHHADDNAETLLLNLLRGSGRPGLGGIRAMRDGIYIRPLLRAFRSDIDAYLRGRGLRWVNDATNADREPAAQPHPPPADPAPGAGLPAGVPVPFSAARPKCWPRKRPGSTSCCSRIVERLLQERAPGRVALDAAALAELPVAVRRRVVRTALQPGAGRPAAHRLRPRRERSRRHGRPAPAGRAVRESHPAGDRHRAGRGHGPAADRPHPDRTTNTAWPGAATLVIPETGETIRLAEAPPGEAGGPLGGDPFTARLDAETVQFPLTIRNRRPGDRFHPLGAGGTQKLKKYFGDHKVAPAERRAVPPAAERRPHRLGRRPPHRRAASGSPGHAAGAHGRAPGCACPRG